MKSSKKIKGLGIFLIILILASSSFLIYNLYLLTGIETFYRIMLSIFVIFFDFLFIKGLFSSALLNYKPKVKWITIVTIILAIIYTLGGFVIFTVYSKISNFHKDTATYSSSLITFNEKYKEIDAVKDTKIGIINDKTNIEGYQIPQEMIKKYELDNDNKIVKYNDDIEMMKALYAEKIDLVFVSSSYKKTYSNIDDFSDIKTKALLVKKQNKEIKLKQNNKNNDKKAITKPFTLLLLGVDSEYEGLDPKASFNGDTIMLITFNPDTLNATMFSIPRDTYVPIACNYNYSNKINSATAYGTKCMIDTVENFTGINIDYYAKINFKGVVGLVNAVGGVDVDVPIKFCEQNSDRKKGKHKICLKPGKQHLNGEQALALARHRKTLPTGDFARGQNQQLVVEALIDKVKDIRSVKAFYNILDTISKNMETDLTTPEMLSFYNIGKKMIFSDNNDVLNIQKTYLVGHDGHVGRMYVFNYDQASLQEIIDVMKINLGKKKAKPVKTFSFSINKEYERYVAGDSNDASKLSTTIVPNFVGKSVDYAKKWGKENNVTIYTTTTSVGNKKYKNGTIVDQSSEEGQFVAFMNGYMTVTVLQR